MGEWWATWSLLAETGPEFRSNIFEENRCYILQITQVSLRDKQRSKVPVRRGSHGGEDGTEHLVHGLCSHVSQEYSPKLKGSVMASVITQSHDNCLDVFVSHDCRPRRTL